MRQQLWLLLFIPVIIFNRSTAQVTTPQIKARFGVDADLRSNFFNGFVQAGNDDWFTLGASSTAGISVIDTTGAAFTLSRYNTHPATRNLPLFREMSVPQFTVVNGRTLIDAVFIRDHHGADSSVFAAGSNKNAMNPADWTCPVAQSVPTKNEILDMYMHVRRDGVKTTDSLWFFGGLSLDGTTGNRYFDFEMYQTDVYYDNSVQKFFGYGPEAGHTAWVFDAAGNVVKTGDIIFTAEYSSTVLTLLEARIWVHQSSLSVTPKAFSWGGLFDGAGTGAVYGYASITPKTAGAFYTGTQCGNNTWAGSFAVVRTDNTIATNYTARQFMEFSVNLSKLGLDPLVSMGDACGLPFRRLMVKSRASTAFTAELKDFVAPFKFFRAPSAELAANFPVMCPNNISDIWVTNPVSTSLYIWEAITGNIVGSTIGPSIVVDQPGEYIVRQQLMDSCGSTYATDTIEITMAYNCQTLDQLFNTLSVKKENKQAVITWNSDYLTGNNFFEVQRSTDGVNFQTVQTVQAKTGGQYKVPDDLSQLQSKWVYYRLRYIPSGQPSFYSKSLSLFNKESNLLSLVTAPNPVTDRLRLSLSLEKSSPVEVLLRNELGAVVYREKYNGISGINEWQISRNSFWKTGMYILEVKMDNEILRRRFLIQ
jgi:hypothetical protein